MMADPEQGVTSKGDPPASSSSSSPHPLPSESDHETSEMLAEGDQTSSFSATDRSSLEPLNLEAIEPPRFKQNSVLPPEQHRLNVEAYATVALSFVVSLMLVGVLGWHCFSSYRLMTFVMQSEIKDGEQVEDQLAKFDKASSLLSDTAATLYAFLGSFATAVVSFYFTSRGSKRDKDHEEGH